MKLYNWPFEWPDERDGKVVHVLCTVYSSENPPPTMHTHPFGVVLDEAPDHIGRFWEKMQEVFPNKKLHTVIANLDGEIIDHNFKIA